MPTEELIDCVSKYDGAEPLLIAGFVGTWICGVLFGWALCKWRTRK